MGPPNQEEGAAPQTHVANVRAVIDANVYVSALLRPKGPPGLVIDRFLRTGAYEMVLSEAIAEEVLRVLSYPKLRRHFARDVVPEEWFADIAVRAHVVTGERIIPRSSRDPDDDKYIAAALEAGAGWIVTGDDDLLALKAYEGVAIIRPSAFLSLLDR